jgi:hypothetical protein
MRATIPATKAALELLVRSLWWILVKNDEELTVKERIELLKWLPLLAKITFLFRRDFGIGLSRNK